MKSKARVILLDSCPVLLHGMEQLLNEQPNLEVCWKGSDPSRAWKAIESKQPDLLMLDVSLPAIDGLDYVKNLHSLYPKLRIFAFSDREESLYAERAIRAGATGYLMKDKSFEVILGGIQQALKGEIVLSENMRARMVNYALNGRNDVKKSPVDRLTDRELQVFNLLGQGYGTRQIAQALSLSVKTIETYRAHLMEKLNLNKATDLMLYAFQWHHQENREESLACAEAA